MVKNIGDVRCVYSNCDQFMRDCDRYGCKAFLSVAEECFDCTFMEIMIKQGGYALETDDVVDWREDCRVCGYFRPDALYFAVTGINARSMLSEPSKVRQYDHLIKSTPKSSESASEFESAFKLGVEAVSGKKDDYTYGMKLPTAGRGRGSVVGKRYGRAAKKLRNEGRSLRQIADILGISVNSVRKALESEYGAF